MFEVSVDTTYGFGAYYFHGFGTYCDITYKHQGSVQACHDS